MSSFQVDENLLIQTLEDEVQNLQLSNIELKTKYKAAKTELKRIEKCRIDLQRRQNKFENEKSKLEGELQASNTRIVELENELQTGKLNFDKLKSEHETSSDQSTINELKSKLRNSKGQIIQLQSENHKHALNMLKSEHEAISSQQAGGERSRNIAVVLHRGAGGLGFSIVGGKDSPKGDLPIYIKTVSGGAAARSGKLKRGDQILSVNGTGLDGFSRDDTVNMLKSLQGQIILTIIPA